MTSSVTEEVDETPVDLGSSDVLEGIREEDCSVVELLDDDDDGEGEGEEEDVGELALVTTGLELLVLVAESPD